MKRTAHARPYPAARVPSHDATATPGTSPSTSRTSHTSRCRAMRPCSLNVRRVSTRSRRCSGLGSGSRFNPGKRSLGRDEGGTTVTVETWEVSEAPSTSALRYSDHRPSECRPGRKRMLIVCSIMLVRCPSKDKTRGVSVMVALAGADADGEVGSNGGESEENEKTLDRVWHKRRCRGVASSSPASYS